MTDSENVSHISQFNGPDQDSLPMGLNKLKQNYLVGLEDMEPDVAIMVKDGYTGMIEAKD